MSETKTKHKWAVVKIDETVNWRGPDRIMKAAGRIFGCYLVDLASNTYCCEMTPSFELNFIESQCANYIADDELNQKVYDFLQEGDAGTPLVRYMHCHTVLSLPPISVGFLPPLDVKGGLVDLGEVNSTEETSYDDAFEAMMEYCRGNMV